MPCRAQQRRGLATGAKAGRLGTPAETKVCRLGYLVSYTNPTCTVQAIVARTPINLFNCHRRR